RAGLHFTGEALAACVHVRARSDGVTIALHANESHQQPGPLRTIVLQQAWARAEVADHDFERSIVVQISRRRPPRRPRLADTRAGLVRQIDEPPIADVPIE